MLNNRRNFVDKKKREDEETSSEESYASWQYAMDEVNRTPKQTDTATTAPTTTTPTTTTPTATTTQPATDTEEYYQTAIDKVLNGGGSTFDLNGSALYNQYKDAYMKQGALAMEDTMGQASALTGGYGNSYAQMLGAQQYKAYMDEFNTSVVPELYSLAMGQVSVDNTNVGGGYLFENGGDETGAFHKATYSREDDAGNIVCVLTGKILPVKKVQILTQVLKIPIFSTDISKIATAINRTT